MWVRQMVCCSTPPPPTTPKSYTLPQPFIDQTSVQRGFQTNSSTVQAAWTAMLLVQVLVKVYSVIPRTLVEFRLNVTLEKQVIHVVTMLGHA